MFVRVLCVCDSASVRVSSQRENRGWVFKMMADMGPQDIRTFFGPGQMFQLDDNRFGRTVLLVESPRVD